MGLCAICSGPIEACSGNNTCKGGRTGLLCGYCPPGAALELVAFTLRTHSNLFSRSLALARTHASAEAEETSVPALVSLLLGKNGLRG